MTSNSDSTNETKPAEYAAPDLFIGESQYRQSGFERIDGHWFAKYVRNDGWEIIVRTTKIPEGYTQKINKNGEIEAIPND
jgi:hypothetical protein